MTSKKYLSTKKTTQQTISTSPALKDWIQRYVKVQHDKFPNDERFKSVSAFYTEVMEQIMDIFEKGKTLEDFDKFSDGEMNEFYSQFTFQGVIPFYELGIGPNKYSNDNILRSTRFLFALRKFYSENFERPFNKRVFLNWFARFKNWVLANKLTKEVNMDVLTGKDSNNPTIIFEFVGTHKNLHYENCKTSIAIAGMFGLKAFNIIYSESELYCRFEFHLTDLFFRSDSARKQRFNLIKENLNYLINYNMIVKDSDYHLWMKMAEDKDNIVFFKNEKARDKWVDRVVNDLHKYGNKEDFQLSLLKTFEKLHWISIESPVNLSFRLNLTKEKNSEEIQFLIDYLSKQSKISVEDGIYYIN